jgi:hypothetical protein
VLYLLEIVTFSILAAGLARVYFAVACLRGERLISDFAHAASLLCLFRYPSSGFPFINVYIMAVSRPRQPPVILRSSSVLLPFILRSSSIHPSLILLSSSLPKSDVFWSGGLASVVVSFSERNRASLTESQC